jgi:HUS1 checkpoint protein
MVVSLAFGGEGFSFLTCLHRQIKVTSLFTGYRIQSNANNEITMILSSEALLAALKSASASAASAQLAGATEPVAPGVVEESDEIVMKLAKKDGKAVLSFEISGRSRMGKKVRVGHDVKVEANP